MPYFKHDGHRLAYTVYGEGPRTTVLLPGLLFSQRMHIPLARELAERGNRVVTLDLLGHGKSARPDDMRVYGMEQFAQQTIGLLDHLDLEDAVVGGTSLGANVSLEMAARFPERTEALFIEMPVLDHALSAVAAIFSPILISLRFGRPVFEALSRATSTIPRSNFIVDLALDMVRQEPGPSLAVLEGLLLGETSPRSAERRGIEHPTLIVGHPNDPLHPFSDSGMLERELPNSRLINATSILEWRLKPDRLNAELASFLDQVWSQTDQEDRAARKARMAGG
jgi:pimeloyl-ACP methyl ester carboxylesterase